MAIRLFGLVLIAICTLAVQRLYGMEIEPPRDEAGGMKMLLSLIVALTGLFGALALLIGKALFRPYRWPPAERARPSRKW